jgi:pimeloyl-ACP methyl ester carboxylesterase
VLLLHGFMDAAGTWDLVASRLADDGLRVLAPDLRGFGEAPRAPAGAYYHFVDYVFDVADIAEAVAPAGSPLILVGHSMGGGIATLYAGAFPERPAALAILEGVGPSDQSQEDAAARMRTWIDGVRAVRTRGEAFVHSREEALRRLAVSHDGVPPEVLASRVPSLARERADGRLLWRADPLHRTRSPTPFSAAAWRSFARRVSCPVLFVSGGTSGWHVADEDERLASFSRLERAELADAGHMMHWTRPDDVARVLARFIASVAPPHVD